MIELIDLIIEKYPWLAFMAVWLFLLGCVYLEYRVNKNKEVASGGLFFLFGFLSFAVTQVGTIGNFKWFLVLCVIVVGWWAIYLVKRKSKELDSIDPY